MRQPAEISPPVPSATPEACSRCGTFYKSVRDVFYSEAGDKVCQACFELADLDAAKDRYARRVRNGAYAAPFFALVAVMATLVFSILAVLLMGVAAISAGGILVALGRDPDLRRRIGWHLLPACICAGLAVLIAGGLAVMFVLGFGVLMIG
jgi:hypothetical protein